MRRPPPQKIAWRARARLAAPPPSAPGGAHAPEVLVRVVFEQLPAAVIHDPRRVVAPVLLPALAPILAVVVVVLERLDLVLVHLAQHRVVLALRLRLEPLLDPLARTRLARGALAPLVRVELDLDDVGAEGLDRAVLEAAYRLLHPLDLREEVLKVLLRGASGDAHGRRLGGPGASGRARAAAQGSERPVFSRGAGEERRWARALRRARARGAPHSRRRALPPCPPPRGWAQTARLSGETASSTVAMMRMAGESDQSVV